MFGSISDIFDTSNGSVQGVFGVFAETVGSYLEQFAGSLGGPRA